MTRKGQLGRGPLYTLGLLLIFCFALKAFPRNAPGVLPWALKPSDKKAQNQKARSSRRNQKRKKKKARRRYPRQSTWGLVQSLQGVAYLGADTNGSSLGEAQTRQNSNDLGLGLQERGFLFDPRFWTHTLDFQVGRSAYSLPLQSNVINSLALNFNGTMFQSRAFPFRIIFTKQKANADLTGPFYTRTNHSNLGLIWSLNNPKLANVTLSAMFGKTDTDNFSSIFLPFREKQQAFSGVIRRSFGKWSVEGNAGYSHIRSSLQGYEYILREQGVRLQRPAGKGGYWTTSLQSVHRSDRSGRSPWMGVGLTRVQTSLTYQHSKKLRGFYSASYLSNIREAVIASALTSSAGQGSIGPGVQPGPALQQALLSKGGSSSVSTRAGWSYQATSRLTFNASLGETLLRNRGIAVDNPALLLKGFTTAGGGATYQRRFGRWTTTWQGNLYRYWNRTLAGKGYADNGRSFDVGITHPLSRWKWTSHFSYSEYSSGAFHGSLYRQERWANSIETRYHRLMVNLGAELMHLNSNYSSLAQFTKNGQNGLLMHGTLAGNRWSASIGQGLRNVNSAIFSLDLTNPLNSALLSEFTPLVSPMMNADRYSYAIGNYRLRRNLALRASYRRDHFIMSQGNFSRFTEIDAGMSYRIGRVRLESGYRQLQQQVTFGNYGTSQIYVRLVRPFTIF